MFTKQVLEIQPDLAVNRITSELLRAVRNTMRRQGAVVGISGGVDSSLVLALCVRAFGPDRVCALIMPERDSDPQSSELAQSLAAQYGIRPIVEDISAVLQGYRCYERRDEAIRRVVPEYDPARGFKAKMSLPPNLLDQESFNFYAITVIGPEGQEVTKPLPGPEFRQIMAASNFKQRTRMSFLYYHAELNNYAVIGTANKNEMGMGFFVKYGDAGVDINPIGHLYKTQVYQLAAWLGVPKNICERQPTSDTYSAPSTQEEFFFRLPFKTMDLLWWAMNHGVATPEVASVMGLSEVQVERAFADFRRKYRATEYLRLPAMLLEPAEQKATGLSTLALETSAPS